jgi:hypothetical protein
MSLTNKQEYYKEASRHEFCDSNFQNLIKDVQNGKFGKDAIFIRYQAKEEYTAKDRKSQTEKLNGLKNNRDFNLGLKRDLKGDTFTILSNTKIDTKQIREDYFIDETYTPESDPDDEFIDPTQFGYKFVLEGFYDGIGIESYTNF